MERNGVDQMVQSLNTKVDLVVKATSYQGLTDYGKLMIGDKGFEFYNDRDASNFIQIPWEEVDYVIASVMFKGKGFLVMRFKRRKMERTLLLQKNRKKFYVLFVNM